MESGKGGDALLGANERIKELENTVAALQERLKVVETKNSKLMALLATLEEPSKIIRPLPEASGRRDVGLEASSEDQGKVAKLGVKYCQKNVLTPRSEPLIGDNIGSGIGMDKSSKENVDDRLSNVALFEDLHTKQQGLEIAPQETSGARDDPNSGLQSEYSPLSIEDGGAIQNQVGQVSRKVKKERKSLQNMVTRHVALRIMYLGSSYHGFASQGVSQRTVESELFAALEHTKLLTGGRAEAKYSRCGRTDKGVSAIGQVIALELRSKLKTPAHESGHVDQNADLDDERFIRDRVTAARASRDLEESVSSSIGVEDEIDYVGVLNRVLPDDIRVLGWCPVPRDFNARFSCLYREYKYFFINADLDLDAMKVAGSKFLGDHDFRNFCKMDAANVHNYRRTISMFEILPVNESWAGRQVWAIRIRGTAFLWHQIRCMAAVLFMVGRRDETAMIVEELLNVGKVTRKPQYSMASELPLVLHNCGFQGVTLHCPSRAAKNLQVHLNNIVEQTVVQLALLQEAVSELPILDLKEDSQLKKQHAPLLGRLTEPSYEERREKKILIPM